MIFDFFRKRETVTPYDRQTQLPIIKSSVCTGEKTACFQDLRTKKITEIMLIRDDRDLAEKTLGGKEQSTQRQLASKALESSKSLDKSEQSIQRLEEKRNKEILDNLDFSYAQKQNERQQKARKEMESRVGIGRDINTKKGWEEEARKNGYTDEDIQTAYNAWLSDIDNELATIPDYMSREATVNRIMNGKNATLSGSYDLNDPTAYLPKRKDGTLLNDSAVNIENAVDNFRSGLQQWNRNIGEGVANAVETINPNSNYKENYDQQLADSGYFDRLAQLNNNEMAGTFAGQVAQGVGSNIMNALLGGATGLSGASLGMAGLGAYGGSSQNALERGLDQQKATEYGLLNAGVELGTELLNPISDYIPMVGQSMGLKDILGEGFEEMESALVEPLLESSYFGGNPMGEYASGDYWKDVLRQGALGSTIALASNPTGAINGVRTDIDNILVNDLNNVLNDAIAQDEEINNKYIEHGLNSDNPNVRENAKIAQENVAEQEANQLRIEAEFLMNTGDTYLQELAQEKEKQAYRIEAPFKAETYVSQAKNGIDELVFKLDKQYFTSNNRKTINKELQTFMREKYQGKQINVADLYDMNVSRAGITEYVNPQKISDRTNDEVMNAKYTISPELETLFKGAIAEKFMVENFKQKEKPHVDYYDYFTINFGIDDGDSVSSYTGRLNVEIRKDGNIFFKDITQIKEKGNPSGIGDSANRTDLWIASTQNIADESQGIKGKQFEILQNSNPMTDDIHTGIRSADEIKTFGEAWNQEQSTTPDFTEADAQRALETGKITVYSSNPIENGTFVTPSRMEAESYAGFTKKKKKKFF